MGLGKDVEGNREEISIKEYVAVTLSMLGIEDWFEDLLEYQNVSNPCQIVQFNQDKYQCELLDSKGVMIEAIDLSTEKKILPKILDAKMYRDDNYMEALLLSRIKDLIVDKAENTTKQRVKESVRRAIVARTSLGFAIIGAVVCWLAGLASKNLLSLFLGCLNMVLIGIQLDIIKAEKIRQMSITETKDELCDSVALYFDSLIESRLDSEEEDEEDNPITKAGQA